MRLRVVKSCGEEWDGMSPRTGGRHCGRCDRVVVDVRGLSRAEAFARLDQVRRERGDVCGRATFDTRTGEAVFAPDPAAPRRKPQAWRGVVLAAALAAGCERAMDAPSSTPVAALAPIAGPAAPKPSGPETPDAPDSLPPPPPAPEHLGAAPDAGTPDDGGAQRHARRHRPQPPPQPPAFTEFQGMMEM